MKLVHPHKIITLIALCLTQLSCVAQNKSTTVQTIDGKKYYMHSVEKGQTLYVISKLYEVDKNDIVLQNPAIIEGIKVGATLKIPYAKPSVTTNETKVTINPNATTHVVEKQQTLYSIAKLYNTTVNELQALNPTVKDNGIKEGDKLLISKQASTTTTTAINKQPIDKPADGTSIVTFDAIPVKTTPKTDEGITDDKQVNIALLLPLFSNAHSDSASLKNKIFSGKSMIALEFYNGFLMGIDSLKKQCVSINLNVFDVENDSLKTLEVLSKKELTSANVVIGPFYTSTALLTSEYCAERNKTYISPVSPNNKVLAGNSKAYKTMASTQSQFEFLGNYVTKNNASDRIVAVYFEGVKQKMAISYFSKYAQLNRDSVHTVNYKKQGLKYLESQLSKTKPNKIILAITEQSVANDIVNKLKTLSKTYDIQLLCGDIYLGFENIDYETLQQLKFRAVTNSYTDYTLPKTQQFVTDYRTKYKSEPSKYSMSGYDLACWIASSYGAYKNINNLAATKYQGIADKYLMKTVGANNGFENYGLYLVGYDALQLIEEK